MCPQNQNVLLFSFHDARRAADVLATAHRLPGLREVAVLACTATGQLRVEPHCPASDRSTVLSRVIDALAVALAGRTTGRRTFSDSPEDVAAFAALVRPGHPVLLVAACDEMRPEMELAAERFQAALYRLPVSAA
ncbi:hypothetical protein SAMN05421835_105303 [Amycolatopsis sacchari]|uniref:Uncharacterized protein n=1 Tax=Amycolatopsis sacchari TaxID=115433 RepID=A0A1I3RIY0_9PSEU|nr:hypothetical protein [Amycolatopsis sacchari]SFJ45291.1 hypothetical protein SAMN05421835_105303 [Amycolatopsis sacchari]